jgi:alcohol dehydrogenase YqhD (iron-dependent ADH family)
MISHLLDPYFFGRKENNFVPSTLSHALIKIIMKITPKVISNPKNYYLRANLMWSAVLANNGILSRGLNPARYYLHMIEHSISGLYKNVPHGAGLSVVIIGWIRYQKIYMQNFLSKFGLGIFDLNKKSKTQELAIKTEKKFYDWLKLIKCPTKLGQLGINKKDFGKIIENIMFEIENEIKHLDKSSLKKFINYNYPEKKLLNNKKKIMEFERQRLFKILSLCD